MWAGSAAADPASSPGTPNQVIEYKELFTIQAQYRQDASEDKHSTGRMLVKTSIKSIWIIMM